jgi:hypothetical protein
MPAYPTLYSFALVYPSTTKTGIAGITSSNQPFTMKKAFLLLGTAMLTTSLFFVPDANAQTFSWIKTGTGNSPTTKGLGISRDANNNLFVAGSYFGAAEIGNTTLPTYGYHDGYVAKLDATGNVLWAKSFGGGLNDFATATACDNNGNVYVTGYFMGTSIVFGTYTLNAPSVNGQSIFIAKYSADGTFQWAKAGAGGTGTYAEAQALTADASGNIIAAGSFQSTFVYGSTSLTGGYTSLYLMKIDGSGNVIWAKVGNTLSFCKLNGLTTDAAGNVYATGKNNNPVNWGGQNFPNHGGDDAFIAKFNASGDIQWHKFLGNSAVAGTTANNWDSGNGIAVDNTGNVYACGALLADSTSVSVASPQHPFVVKYNSAGVQQWLKKYTALKENVLNGITTDASGKVYITGTYSESMNLDAVQLPGSAFNSKDIFMGCLANTGAVLWAIRCGSPSEDVGNGVTRDNNNNIIFTGSCSNGAEFDTATLYTGNTQMYVAKMGGTGGPNTNGIEELEVAGYKIYPNPATTSLHVETQLSKSFQVKIMNAAGQLVSDAGEYNRSFSLDISALAAGHYFISMAQADGHYTVARFIKK